MQPLLGLLAATIGIGITIYIHRKKRTKAPLMCPRNANCDDVINSRYGKTFGISNDVLGLLYYIFVGVVYSAILVRPDLVSVQLEQILAFFVGAAAFFSLYLMAIQAYVLKKWCIWCLGAAAMNIALALITFLG
jgi:uncharacterized membrane protein